MDKKTYLIRIDSFSKNLTKGCLDKISKDILKMDKGSREFKGGNLINNEKNLYMEYTLK
jgi:hypothetical protein